MTTMGLQYLSYQENVRSNIARENENIRHNTTTEGLGTLSFGESVRSNLANESLKLGSLDEEIRSNQAREYENYRSNLARETENNRANLANENFNIYRTDLNTIAQSAPMNAAIFTDTYQSLGGIDKASVMQEGFGNLLRSLIPFTGSN